MRYLRITIFSVISVILAIIVRKYWFDTSGINGTITFLMAILYYYFMEKQKNKDVLYIYVYMLAIHILIFGLYSVFVLNADAMEFVGVGTVCWTITIWNELNRNND